MAMLDAALPGLAADQAPALAAAFAQRLMPMLRGAPEARLLVAPGFADATRALLPDAAITIEEDATLPAAMRVRSGDRAAPNSTSRRGGGRSAAS